MYLIISQAETASRLRDEAQSDPVATYFEGSSVRL